jgi:hypothetical protein
VHFLSSLFEFFMSSLRHIYFVHVPPTQSRPQPMHGPIAGAARVRSLEWGQATPFRAGTAGRTFADPVGRMLTAPRMLFEPGAGFLG